MIGLLITITLFPLAGKALSRLLGPLSSYLGGLGIVGIVLWLGAILHVPMLVMVVLMLLSIAGVLLCFRSAPRPPRSRFPLVADLAIAIPALAILSITAVTPFLDYDGIAFWTLKAKAISHEQAIDGPFFTGRGTFSPRNRYPLLLPLDAALTMTLAPGDDDMQINWIYPLLLIAYALEVRRRLSSATSRKTAAWCAAVLLWLPQFVTQPEGGAMSAYSDIAFAAFGACAFFELIEPERPARFAFWLVCLVLTKNEGLPYSVIMLLPGVWVFRKRITGPALATLTAIGSLLLWRSGVAATDEEDLFGRLALLAKNVDRIPEATLGFFRYPFVWSAWGTFWIATLAAITVLAWRRRWRELTLSAAATVPLLAVYLAVFTVTAWSLPELLAVSAARLWMHFVGPALFLIASALHTFEKQGSRRHPYPAQ